MRQISPKRLKPHRANRRVYADGPIDDLLVSIAEHGILQPLVATKSMTLISGHRRLKAALELGLKTVPVIIRDVDDEIVAIVKTTRTADDAPIVLLSHAQYTAPRWIDDTHYLIARAHSPSPFSVQNGLYSWVTP